MCVVRRMSLHMCIVASNNGYCHPHAFAELKHASYPRTSFSLFVFCLFFVYFAICFFFFCEHINIHCKHWERIVAVSHVSYFSAKCRFSSAVVITSTNSQLSLQESAWSQFSLFCLLTLRRALVFVQTYKHSWAFWFQKTNVIIIRKRKKKHSCACMAYNVIVKWTKELFFLSSLR